MQFDNSISWVPDLEDAIERHPLIVEPNTPLVDVITVISQAHRHTCLLEEEAASLESSVKPAVSVSCVLVMQKRTILGILTERDVVRLTAKAIDFQAATVADVMVHPVITLPEQSVQDMFAALFLFRRYRIRHLPIVDDQEQLVGVISHESIRQVLRPANLLRFRRVSDVMTTNVIHAPLTATVWQLAQLMTTHRVSCIVITQPDSETNEQPVGIVTERDIVQFQALQINLGKTEAQTVMSSPLFLLNPEDSLWMAHQEMQKRRVGRLVVSWNWGKGLGIVTQTSLLRVFDPTEMYGVIENLQQTIQQLQAKQAGQLSSNGSFELEPQLVNPSSKQLLPKQNISPSSTSIVCDGSSLAQRTNHLESCPYSPSGILQQGNREILFSWLDRIHATVMHMVANPDLSIKQQRAQLQSVLDALKQVYRHINS
ncbi:MAG: CBS domain-containing protein [Symploca sp. SIO1C4]|uniref:CBS domain-containing protein n=1 Tax=Symploca sp. SIO1C4 TaxID=2607765 RepID=A0A6B3N6A2_9CYAN|nr:CBS domain-containing protein [Symploca sp. SIO1C4]